VAGIVLSFSIVPAVIIALSLWSFSRYPLRKADIEAAASEVVV
jgi:GPH family glycoside/pentoside/hexuronide:cation symporter